MCSALLAPARRDRRGGWAACAIASCQSWAAVAAPARATSKSKCTVRTGLEHLAHLAVEQSFLIFAVSVGGDDASPEAHCGGVALELRYFPASGEAIEDQLNRHAPDPQAAPRSRDEKLGHAIVDLRLRRQGGAASDHGEADVLGSLQDDQRKSVAVPKPARHLVRLTVPDLAEGGKQARRIHRREIVEIVAVDTLDPQAIPFGGACVSHTDGHGRQVSC